MNRHTPAILAASTVILLGLAAAQVPPAPDAYITDAAGDAGGKDPLDILQAGMNDDGVKFSFWVEVKGMGSGSPAAPTQLKQSWRFHIEVANLTDATKIRRAFVQVQVAATNDETGPTRFPQAPGGPFAGTVYQWGTMEADGSAVIRGTTTGSLDLAKNRALATLDFATFRQTSGTHARLDVAQEGVVQKVWAQTLDSAVPTQSDNAASPAWTQVDKAEQTKPYVLGAKRASAASPATSAPTSGGAANTSSVSTSTTTSTSGNASTNATAASSPTDSPGRAKEAELPGLPWVAVVGALAAMAAAASRRR